MLVFGVASIANAGVLQISVDGDPNPINSEIELKPGETVVLDILTVGDIGVFESHNWALVVDSAFGSISGGVALVQPGVNQMGGIAPDPDSDVLPDEPLAGVWGIMSNTTFSPIADGTVFVDQIEFKCVGEGDAVIQLYEMVSGVPFPSQGGTLMDEVIIHQIPEPMTIALLGFGGLLALRRRK
jgi:hypothetical protein